MSRVSPWLLGGLLLGLGVACEGGPEDAPKKVVQAAVTGDQVRGTWMVKVAEPGKLDALAGHPGWQAFHARDYAKALAAGAEWDGVGRVHAELSSLYRQAALLAAQAIEQTYKPEQRREGDPKEVEYLLGVAHLVLGNTEAARAALGQNGSSTDAALAAADTAWAERLVADAPLVARIDDARLWPLGGTVVGESPDFAPAPHFELPETVGDRRVKTGDPTVLLQLAAWHEAAAITAIGPQRTAALIAPWRLPGEAAVTVDPSVIVLEDLFLSAFGTAGDLARASGSPAGDSGSTFQDLLAACDGTGAAKAQCAADAAGQLRQQVLSAMEMVSGSPSPNHRAMAAFAEAGALRAGVRAADGAGDREAAGLLRIAAKDQSDEAAVEPVFMVALAAWDAGNRNPLRAQELLHAQLRRAPGLDAARYALDALHLRVSRDSGPGMPMH